jgi:hypothetical protein
VRKSGAQVGGQDLRDVVDNTLRHGQRAIPDVKREQEFALGVHGGPDPMRGTLQALDGVGRADFPVLDRAEQGKQLIELDLSDPYAMQEVLREGVQLLRRLHEPLQDRLRVHLEDPRRAPDTHAFGQARDDAHDALDGSALAMKERAKGLKKIAATGDTQQLSPGTTIGMAIGAQIPPGDPAPIGTVWVGAKMLRGYPPECH